MNGAVYLFAALVVIIAALGLYLMVAAIARRVRTPKWSTDISLTERLERSLGAAAVPRSAQPSAPVTPSEPPVDAAIDVLAIAGETVKVVPVDAGAEPEPAPEAAPPLRGAATELIPPEYRLLAPVELRFVGERDVVGVRADTETVAAFQRIADALTEGIQDDGR